MNGLSGVGKKSVRRGVLGRLVSFSCMAFVVFASLAGGGCDRPWAQTDKTVAVTVAKAFSGQLGGGDLLTGKIMAAQEVSLTSKMAGKVATISVEVGDRVKAGQVVLRLDAPEIGAAIGQAAAAVKVAEAGINQAVLGVERAKVAVEQAQEGFRIAKANYDRGRVLLGQEVISQADFEARYEQPYVTAEGIVKTADGLYSQAVDQKEQVAPAQLNQARATLAVQRVNAANTILVTPISGLVATRTTDPGELTSPTMPVLTVINIDEVAMEGGVSEQQVNKFNVGQQVKVSVAAARAEPFVGRISTIGPSADPKTKMYSVKVMIPNSKHLLKPGMFAEADLDTMAVSVLVPREAVVVKDQVSVVFVAKGDKAALRLVTKGASDGSNTVVKGIFAGEQVVITNQEQIKDGSSIVVVE